MTRQPYSGHAQKIVFAFDVGTTQTGVSYCILEPGEIPQIRSMHKFPGQELVNGSYKIPTIMYYNSEGRMVSAGAETVADDIRERAEEEDWIKVEWFKLRFRPKDMSCDFKDADLGSLPLGKTVDDMYTDFYGYLLKCCESFINEVHPTYLSSWGVLMRSAVFILCHPNGWKGAQQGRMREAAIKAGLVPDTKEGRNRVQFVTEGEASLHYCIEQHHLDLSDEGLIVADLGGGTLDFSAYNIISRSPIVFHESSAAKCALEGSEIITKHARSYLKDKLKNSKYGANDDIDEIVKVFDSRNKRIFRSNTETVYIPFGRVSCKDPKFGIMGGKLKLGGDEVEKFYEPSLAAAQTCITQCVFASPVKVSAIYLVGGLSGNLYVKSELNRRFEGACFKIRAPGDSNIKAAALGALGFYLDHHVEARVAKYDYGVNFAPFFIVDDPEHIRRRKDCTTLLSGVRGVLGGFDTILSKGTVVKECTSFSHSFEYEIVEDQFATARFMFSKEILAYSGSRKTINWIDEIESEDDIDVACTLHADLSALRYIITSREGYNGAIYRPVPFDLVIWFGGPEIKAQIHWTEHGEDKWGPASIIYGDDCSLEKEGMPEEVRRFN